MHNYHDRGQVAGQQTTSTVVHQSTQQNEPSAAAGSEIIRPQPSLLQELTDSGNDFTPVPTSAISLTMGVDDKTRHKIFANTYVKLSSLLPTDAEYADNKYKSIEKEGQLIFVKQDEKKIISSVTKWMEVFHIYVAIYSEKHPQEIGNVMIYAQTIQKMADTCWDSAALNYDEKFRRWRAKDPAACPWHKKIVELYQEAVVMGMDFKLRN